MPPSPLEFATAEQVWECLAEIVRPGPGERVEVADSLHAYLRADARVQHDYPPFDRAVMDGYAVDASAFADGPTTLREIGLVQAGDDTTLTVTPETCLRINTGAPLPSGANAVVIVEKSTAAGAGQVHLDDQPRPGQHIEPKAKLSQAGDLLVRAGTRVEPGTLSALVAAGLQQVEVFKRPTVSLLSTGNELVQPGETLGPGQIHDSNRIALHELAARSGARPRSLGRAPDEMDALQKQLSAGLSEDVLIVVGGMSKGSHDLVPAALEALGVEWLVTSLKLKPGKPTRIGRLGDSWVLGLPGNPVSACVCYLLFAEPILRALQGCPLTAPPLLSGTLTSEMPACGPRPMFQPGAWEAGPRGTLLVSPIQWSGSGDPFGMATANCLIRRPADASAAPRGETISFHPIGLPE